MFCDEIIVNAVKDLQRRYRRGIFPWMVVSELPFYMSEGYIRKTMARLWQEGRLHRIGGANSRKGYMAPLRISRLRMVGMSRVA